MDEQIDDRRKAILGMDEEQFRIFVDQQLRIGDDKLAYHRALLESNTSMTENIDNNTAELVEFFKATKNGAQFLYKLGRALHHFAKWAVPIASLGAAVYALWHGTPPKGDH